MRRWAPAALLTIALGSASGVAIGRNWNWLAVRSLQRQTAFDCTREVAWAENNTWSSLAITGGSGSFAAITSRNKSMVVQRGAQLEGTVALQLDFHAWRSFHAEMIGTPTWGDPRNSYWRIAWTVPDTQASIRMSAPPAAGPQYIIFALSLDMTAEQVASETDWGWPGGPNWSKRTAIAAWQPAQIAQAQRQGCTVAKWLLNDGKYRLRVVPADAISVIVQ